MARPLRIEYPGACYHVINRGNQRQAVFHNPSHYSIFIDKLGHFAKEYGIIVHCFCCMPNHFHLYLQTQETNLSRFMLAFLTSFTVSINRLRRTSGHVFQGRFKSHLVEDELYRPKLSRYLHLNPVRVSNIKKMEVAGKKRHLHDFQW